MARHASLRKSISSALALALTLPAALIAVAFDPIAPPANAAACSAGVVTPLHGSKVYYDTKGSPDYQGMYLGYQVTLPTSETSVTVSISMGNGANDALNPEGPTSQSLGANSAGVAQKAFFLVEANNSKNAPGTTVTVTVNYGSSNCTFVNEIVATKPTLAANANKIYSGSVATTADVGPGSKVYVAVTGNTGTIGSGPDGDRQINLSPVANLANFDSAAWRLTGTEFRSANTLCGDNGVVLDRLFFSTTTTPSSANCNGLYTAIYEYTAQSSASSSNNDLQAFAYIASGNLIKHTSPFSGTISLPGVNLSAPVVTENRPNSLNVLNAAEPTFTVNDVDATTAVNTNIVLPEFTYLGLTTGIDWSRACLVNPADATQCSNTSYLVNAYDEETGTSTGTGVGTFALIDGPNGDKRISFSPKAGYVTPTGTSPANIVFRIYDTSNPAEYSEATAFVRITNDLIAKPVFMTTPQGSATESATLQALNLSTQTLNTNLTCFVVGAGCSSNSYTVTGSGVWSITGSGTKITFTPDSGFTGTATIDFKLTDSSARTSQATATVDVFPVPTLSSENASTSAQVNVTLSPTITGDGPFTKCLSLTSPVSTPCSTTSVSAGSVSWSVDTAGIVSFSSLAGYTGVATVYMGVTDAKGQFVTASMNVEVLPPTPPTITDETQTISTSESVTFSPTLTASTSYTLCIVWGGYCVADASGASPYGLWKVAGNKVSYQSANSYFGTDEITLRITDAAGQSATGTMSAVVTKPAAPTVEDAEGETNPDTPKVLSPTRSSILPLSGCFIDPADETSCVESLAIAGFGTWSTTSNGVKFTPVSGSSGQTTISYRVVDTVQQSSSAVMSVTISSLIVFTSTLDSETEAASSVTETTATLRGSAYAGANTTTNTFCYGTAPDLSSCTTINGSPINTSGGQSGSVSAAITGLTGSTTYYFRIIADDGVNTATGATLSFTTNAASATPPPVTPTASSAPVEAEALTCSPEVDFASTAQSSVSAWDYFMETMYYLFTGVANTIGSAISALGQTPVGNLLLASQTATLNPLIAPDSMQQISQGKFAAGFLAPPAKTTAAPALDPSDILITPGDELGTVEIQSVDGSALELGGDVQSVDLDLYTQYTGAQLNNPLVWQNEGYGTLCWKLEPFTETSFILPDPIEFPGTTPDGEWVYSNVIVKAGSLTADPTTFQVNTLFPGPQKGSMVWADVNGNGIYDPGGKNGDKAISHIVICIKRVSAANPAPTQSAQLTQSPEVSATPSPSPTQTSASPSPTASTTPSPTVSETPSPTISATPSPTVTVTPTPTASLTPTPTPSPTSTLAACPKPSPSVSPTIAPPSPTPTTTSIIILMRGPIPTPTPSSPVDPIPSPSGSATPSPTPTSSVTPTPSDSTEPTPTPTGSVTPTPAPSSSVGPTPTPSATTEPTPTPSQTSTPLPTAPIQLFSPVDLNPPTNCVPNATYGVAMKLTNGLSTMCYRVTSTYFAQVANREISFELLAGGEAIEAEELADTGIDISLLGILIITLAGAGALSLAFARKRD